jgi:hypothetical protein
LFGQSTSRVLLGYEIRPDLSTRAVAQTSVALLVLARFIPRYGAGPSRATSALLAQASQCQIRPQEHVFDEAQLVRYALDSARFILLSLTPAVSTLHDIHSRGAFRPPRGLGRGTRPGTEGWLGESDR